MPAVAGLFAADPACPVPADILAAMAEGMVSSCVDAAWGLAGVIGMAGHMLTAFDGGLTNPDELRRDLGDGSDADLAARGIDRWGPGGFLQRAHGAFAFLAVDRRRQTIFAGRDPSGERPLYFTRTHRWLAIASGLPGLVESGLLSAHIDELALWEFLRFGRTLGRRTLAAGVEELPPGHWLSWSGSEPSVTAAVPAAAPSRAGWDGIDPRQVADFVWAGGMPTTTPVGSPVKRSFPNPLAELPIYRRFPYDPPEGVELTAAGRPCLLPVDFLWGLLAADRRPEYERLAPFLDRVEATTPLPATAVLPRCQVSDEVIDAVRATVLGPGLRALGLFDPAGLELLVAAERMGRPVFPTLWGIALLTHWFEHYRREAERAAVSHRPRLLPKRSADPGVLCDLVVPVHEGLAYVRDMLRSVAAYTDPARTPYRLWLIDDGSDLATHDRLRELADADSPITLVRTAENLGFVQAVNHGIHLGSAPFVVMLNTDILVGPGWLERMVRCATSDPRIALVNPVCNRAATLSVDIPPGMSLETIAARLAEETPEYPDVVTVVGFCLLVRREALDWLGPLDPIFGMGYCEESDLHMRFTERGLRAVLADDAFVYHKGSGTFTDSQDRSLRNRQVFDSRWEEAFLRDWRAFRQQGALDRLRRRLLMGTIRKAPGWEAAAAAIEEAVIARPFDATEPVGETLLSPETAARLRSALADGERWCKDDHEGREVFYPTAPYLRSLTPTGGLRVTFLVSAMPPNGGVVSIVQLARELTLSGQDVKLVTLSEDALWPERYHLPCQPIIFPDFARLVRDFPESDVVVATYWQTATDWLPALKRRHRFRAVYFVQDYESWFYPNGHPDRRRVISGFAEAELRVVMSDWLGDLLAAHGLDSVKVPIGIDRDVFYPRQRPLGDGRLRVLAAARPLEPYRGYYTLARVYAEIARRRPDVELCVYGCTDADLADRPMPVPVTNLGRTTDPNHVARFCSSATVLFDPSDFQALGRPGLEAMACGTATVLPNVGGIQEYASDGVNCLTVRPGDVRAAAGAIVRLLNDSDERARLVAAGLETARRYCHRVEARRHLDLYRRLVTGGPSAVRREAA